MPRDREPRANMSEGCKDGMRGSHGPCRGQEF